MRKVRSFIPHGTILKLIFCSNVICSFISKGLLKGSEMLREDPQQQRRQNISFQVDGETKSKSIISEMAPYMWNRLKKFKDNKMKPIRVIA